MTFCIGLFSASCSDNKEIFRLLKSTDKEDVIQGAFQAGESGDKHFIPLLLQNAADPRRSTDIFFKGITVYQSKMIALQKILKLSPPNEISYKIDSNVIKFYIMAEKNK